ncbi:MAG TPA: zf-HC2 domain-containing protein [Deltaproteobacteria bacterium]|nr:zf-HC2 domain-containing protein [Deltaproteobacteria bacterium]HQH99875.1 zf-HC2 domain-containing protein [Deltaproteobacteria bacterium]HQJ08598.1 zf-HC2 domain-containing protein [Deltaproteobacteria bacterium]
MNCRRTKKMISPYIDDELTPREKEAFLEHIGKCQECSRELEEARAVHLIFTKTERSQAPYGFTERVMAETARKDAQRKSFWELIPFRPLLPGLVEVACALAIMVLGIIAGNQLVLHSPAHQERAGIEQAFSLDVFQANPPGSVEGAYARIMEAGNEG